jgi:steroid delta-isomerase-like uncharacterized protein
MMATKDNIAKLRAVIEAINGGDTSLAARSVTPDFARHDLTGIFASKGAGGTEVTDFLGAMLQAMPDFRINVEDAFGVDDRVTARYRFSGTHERTLLGVAGTHQRIEFSGINIYRFEGDLFAEVWQLWDWASVLQQLGLLATGSKAGD